MAKDDSSGTGKKNQPIIVKKINKGGHGHHGGAWKVAYADFVTAMMAFFLLLWLLNVTTEEQKNAISDYFDPSVPKVSQAQSGAGGVLGGLTISSEGAMTSTKAPPAPQKAPPQNTMRQSGQSSPEQMKEEALRNELKKREERKFEQAKKNIERALQKNADLSALAKNLMIDITPEGLRIQIVDQDGKPMFPSASADPYEKTRQLLAVVAEAIEGLPNQISIRGHTDAMPMRRADGYTNWELSADRANASRRVLLDNGIPESRIANVVGKAATEPLLSDQPNDAQNRRLSIILLRDSLTAQGAQASADGSAAPSYTDIPSNLAPTGTSQPSEGRVKFP
jgi:chemotaxis protein MotB